jgi:hypothetical protein
VETVGGPARAWRTRRPGIGAEERDHGEGGDGGEVRSAGERRKNRGAVIRGGNGCGRKAVKRGSPCGAGAPGFGTGRVVCGRSEFPGIGGVRVMRSVEAMGSVVGLEPADGRPEGGAGNGSSPAGGGTRVRGAGRRWKFSSVVAVALASVAAGPGGACVLHRSRRIRAVGVRCSSQLIRAYEESGVAVACPPDRPVRYLRGTGLRPLKPSLGVP